MNDKTKSRKLMSGGELLSWFPAIITIIQIWRFSLEPGSVSELTSASVASGELLRSLFGVDSERYFNDELYRSAYHGIIRDIAHISEYGILSLCVWFACSICKVKGRLRCIYAILIPFIISCMDEFIQIFVPDRSCEIKDVLFDVCGAILMVMFLWALSRVFGQKRKIKEEEKRYLFNITIDNISFDKAIEVVQKLSSNKNGRHYIVTPNVDHVIKLEKDQLFQEIYDSADLVVTDGTPLLWMMDSIGYPLKEKVTGADMLPKVCEMAAKNKRSVYILGAAPGIAQRATEKLEKQYKGLNIVGSMSPEPGFENSEEQVRKVIDAVNDKTPDILVLALGSPKQEKFIYKYRDEMNFGVALPFGAAVDFAADNVRRAPLWIRKAGLEWLFRFLQEPGRLFRRYFIDDIKIFLLFWKYRKSMLADNSDNQAEQ